MSRRHYSSTAAKTALSGSIGTSDTTFSVAALTGYPAVPYTAAINRGLADEELVEVTGTSGTSVTVTRAVDGSTAKTHTVGATFEHVVSARDFDEPNAHVNATTSVHGVADMSQLLTASAADALFLTPAEGNAAYQPKVTGSPTTASVAAAQATSSATFTDLTTVGPSVTVTTGSSVLVLFSAYGQNTVSTSGNRCAVAVSGATTRAASFSEELYSSGAGNRGSQQLLLTGLTPGSNTFTLKYAANGDSATFSSRTITVIPQ